MLTSVLGTIVEGPSNVTYIPGLTPLPIELICNGTGFLYWQVDGLCYFLSSLTNGELPGHNCIGSNILVNSPVNNTEYICASPSYDFTPCSIYSDPAYIVIAGKTCIHIYMATFCIHLLYFAWAREKCTFIYILYTSKAQVCCICPSYRKYSTLAKYSKLGQVTVSID